MWYLHEIKVTEFPAEKEIDLLGKLTVVSKPGVVPRAVDCSKALITLILPVLHFVLFDRARNYNHPFLFLIFQVQRELAAVIALKARKSGESG